MTDNAMTWGGETTANERTLAMAAHGAAFILPLMGPLLIYLLKKDESAFVGYHGMQAFVFQLIATLLGAATCGVALIILILPILWAVKAHEGKWEGYPLIDGIGHQGPSGPA